jgi:hypothetical protein
VAEPAEDAVEYLIAPGTHIGAATFNVDWLIALLSKEMLVDELSTETWPGACTGTSGERMNGLATRPG